MNRQQRRLTIAAVVTLAFDAASKLYAVHALDNPIEIGGSLSLQLSHNPGVAFGLGQALPSALVLTITGLVCISVAVGGWTGVLRPPVAVGLIIGGAVGNLLDRLSGGSVVDIIHLTWWPTFNLADSAITVGAAGVIVSSLRPAIRDTAAVVRENPR